jgi:glycosyltransferase involved in cell wall biosynthesis
MKKVLILTYYLPPYTGIEGHRPNSWANNFAKHGLYPVVLCRHWNHIPQNWTEYQHEDSSAPTVQEDEKRKIIFIPYKKRKGFRTIDKLKVPGLLSLYYWYHRVAGNFHIETDAFYNYMEAAEKVIREDKIDLILVTSPPMNVIKLGYTLSKKFDIPLVIDMRDSYDNEELNPAYKPSRKQSIFRKFYRKYLGKWMSQAALVSTVSDPMVNLFRSLTNSKIITVLNGFEKDLYNDVRPVKFPDQFSIALIGTLYPQQDIDFMLNGLKEFLKDKDPSNVRVVFIGIKNKADIASRIQAAIPQEFLFMTGRIPRKEALEYTVSASVLVHIGWKGYKGIFSGKLFEYLGSGRNILITPSDRDVMATLVNETGAGKAAETITEMAAMLESWYKEWSRNKTLAYSGKADIIQKYTRETQAEVLAKAIKQELFS